MAGGVVDVPRRWWSCCRSGQRGGVEEPTWQKSRRCGLEGRAPTFSQCRGCHLGIRPRLDPGPGGVACPRKRRSAGGRGPECGGVAAAVRARSGKALWVRPRRWWSRCRSGQRWWLRQRARA
ncbi:hypothetical protein NDU88_002877 [Pleurodeles waltl]|uniref:Uncharacterized protein n=1 Tax=Pleurodeles waltl TaxID=8319 RepID=A0AAV7UYM0_PLEWA|nr:hypothetical protein NDU88_002877 [Pleurodeles waltl]